MNIPDPFSFFDVAEGFGVIRHGQFRYYFDIRTNGTTENPYGVSVYVKGPSDHMTYKGRPYHGSGRFFMANGLLAPLQASIGFCNANTGNDPSNAVYHALYDIFVGAVREQSMNLPIELWGTACAVAEAYKQIRYGYQLRWSTYGAKKRSPEQYERVRAHIRVARLKADQFGQLWAKAVTR